MHQSNESDFNRFAALKLQGQRFSQTSAEFVKSFTHRRIAPISLITLLGWGGFSWVATSVITPQIAQAYTARVDLSLNGQLGETYEGFVRRAEVAARAAAQRSFDRDILVTEVSVTILGQNQGSIAPVLTLEVTRQAWKSRPDPQRWTRYFPATRSLLGFVEGVPVAQPAPAAPAPTEIPAVETPAPIVIPTVPGTQAPPQPGVPNTPPNLTPGAVPPGVGTGINPQGGPTVPTTPGGTPNTVPRTTPGGLNAPGSTGGGNPNTVPRTTPGSLTQ